MSKEEFGTRYQENGFIFREPLQFDATPGKTQSIIFKFHYLQEQAMYMKIAATTHLDIFCKTMCQRKGVEFDQYSFDYDFGHLLKNQQSADMGLTIEKLSVLGDQMLSLILTRKPKKYSVTSLIENNEEAAIANYISGKYSTLLIL